MKRRYYQLIENPRFLRKWFLESQNDKNDNIWKLGRGEKFDIMNKIYFKISEKWGRKEAADFVISTHGLPITSKRFGDIIESIDKDNIQRIPVIIEGYKEGEFEIINIIKKIDCIDYESSDVKFFYQGETEADDYSTKIIRLLENKIDKKIMDKFIKIDVVLSMEREYDKTKLLSNFLEYLYQNGELIHLINIINKLYNMYIIGEYKKMLYIIENLDFNHIDNFELINCDIFKHESFEKISGDLDKLSQKSRFEKEIVEQIKQIVNDHYNNNEFERSEKIKNVLLKLDEIGEYKQLENLINSIFYYKVHETDYYVSVLSTIDTYSEIFFKNYSELKFVDEKIKKLPKIRGINKLKVNVNKIPVEVDIFRIKNWLFPIIISEKVKNALDETGLRKGVIFIEV